MNWTEEEAQVQRILGNLRGNQPEPPAPGRAAVLQRYNNEFMIDHNGNFAPAPRAADGLANVDDNMKRGIIQLIYDDCKIVSDKELYDIVLQSKAFFEVDPIDQDAPRSAAPIGVQLPVRGIAPPIIERERIAIENVGDRLDYL